MRVAAIAQRKSLVKVRTTYNAPFLRALEEAAPPDHMSLIYESTDDHYAVPVRAALFPTDRIKGKMIVPVKQPPS